MMIPQNVASGAAHPIYARDASGLMLMKYETGRRIRKDWMIP